MLRNIFYFLGKKLNKLFIIQILPLLCLCFFTNACQSKSLTQPKLPINLSQKQRAQLGYLFNDLFFKDFGIFVLFGSKPMAVTTVLNDAQAEEYEQQMWQQLSDEQKKEYAKALEEAHVRGTPLEKLEEDPYDCWLTFQKILKELNVKKYVFGLWPVENEPCLYELYIADVAKTALEIEKHYAIFYKIMGEDFHPLEVVFELDNINSSFWKKVFANHLAMGILFGFGRKNALYYEWSNHYLGNHLLVKDFIQNVDWKVSTKKNIHYFEANSANFSIPRFGCFKGDKYVKRYRKKRKKIQKIYSGKDMIDVTLTRLIE